MLVVFELAASCLEDLTWSGLGTFAALFVAGPASDRSAALGGGWTLAAGLAPFQAGSAPILGGSRRSWHAVWPWPVVAVPIVLAAAALPHENALLLVAGLAVVCLALAVRGTVIRRADC